MNMSFNSFNNELYMLNFFCVICICIIIIIEIKIYKYFLNNYFNISRELMSDY